MAIWKTPINKEQLNTPSTYTLAVHLGIEFIEVGDDFLKAKMAVDERTRQPYGIMHGGASCVLAETVGSLAGYLCTDGETQAVVGLSIYTNHIHMVKEGYVYGTAKPIHLGRTTQVWEVDIVDDGGKLISVTRLTLAVIDRKR